MRKQTDGQILRCSTLAWKVPRSDIFFYDKSTRSQCNEGSGGAELTHALRQAGGKGR